MGQMGFGKSLDVKLCRPNIFCSVSIVINVIA